MNFIASIIRHIDGPLGIRLRRWYYRRKCKHLGERVRIEAGVYILNPKDVSIDNDVWIDRNVIIIAGKTDLNSKSMNHMGSTIEPGSVRIGTQSHIGVGTVIQGHGGVLLGKNFTSSAYCKIYSLSNIPSECQNGTMNSGHASYWSNPLETGENVWLGLGVSYLSGKISKDVFVRPNSIVTQDIAENSIAAGDPAIRVRTRFA